MKAGYKCDNCDGFHTNKNWIFKCVYCGKEICEWCFDYHNTCKECSKGKSETEVIRQYIAVYGNGN